MEFKWLLILVSLNSSNLFSAAQLNKNKALLAACSERDFLKARLLLEQNADPNYQDPTSKDTPLVAVNRDLLREKSSVLITDLLLVHKANVGIPNHVGRKPLYYAATTGQRAAFLHILRASGDLQGNISTKGVNIFQSVEAELEKKDLSKSKRYKLQLIRQDIANHCLNTFNALHDARATQALDTDLVIHICEFNGTIF